MGTGVGLARLQPEGCYFEVANCNLKAGLHGLRLSQGGRGLPGAKPKGRSTHTGSIHSAHHNLLWVAPGKRLALEVPKLCINLETITTNE
jgi:hypothetical protein